MNKCTLLIDGNWLLNSRFSVMSNLFNATLSEARLQSAKENLKDMMARSINFTLNRLPMIDNVVLVTDGGSWRKQLPVPNQLGGETYKGNRTQNVEISFEHIYKALSELSRTCANQGLTVCQQPNVEGDDWIWYWTRKLNNEGVSCIIWSSDHDLMQLVQKTDNAFTGWYYDRKGITHLVLPKELVKHNPSPEDEDFLEYFMGMCDQRPHLVEDLEKRMQKVEYIDPNTIITGKVVCGDSGDNIKSIVRMMKGGRTYGVGEVDWKKISGALGIESIQDLISNKDDLATYILQYKKFVGHPDITKAKLLEMIDYNIKLVWLNEEAIPMSIITAMNQQEYKQVDVNYLRGSYKTLLNDMTDAEKNFAGLL